MEANVTVTLINEQGWQKHYQLSEGVHWIGSDAKALVQIVDAKDLDPLHLQVVNNQAEACIRLLNLSKADIILQKGDKQSTLEAGGFADLFGEATLFLSTYTLRFKVEKEESQKQAVLERKQKTMGVRLVLSDVVLRPDTGPIIGTLSLQNLGEEACQFEVNLDGLPKDCYEILPPPLIYAGGEESSEIRIYHRHISPPAGIQSLTLRVSAPNAYPGKEIRIEQTIKVLSCYEHSIQFIVPEGQPAKKAQPAPAENKPREEIAIPEPVLVKNTPPVETAIPEPVRIPPPPPTVTQHVQTPVEQSPAKPSIGYEEKKVAEPVEDSFLSQVYPKQNAAEETTQMKLRPAVVKQEIVEELPIPEIHTSQPSIIAVESEGKTIKPSESAAAEETQEIPPVAEQLDEEIVTDEQAPEEMEPEMPVFRGVRKPSRPDLSSVKVMKASTGAFLQKKEGE